MIAGDESETNNDDVDESPLAQESTTSSQEELQRLKVELQLAKVKAKRLFWPFHVCALPHRVSFYPQLKKIETALFISLQTSIFLHATTILGNRVCGISVVAVVLNSYPECLIGCGNKQYASFTFLLTAFVPFAH